MVRPIDSSSEHHDSGDDILVFDFSDIVDARQDYHDSSSDHGDGSDAAIPRSTSQASEDGPTSQLLREATSGQSPRESPERADEAQTALLNSTLIAHGRRPAPLPTRSERRLASRDGSHPTFSTPRRTSGPPRPNLFGFPPDSPGSNPPSTSAQRGTQHEYEQKPQTRQLRSSVRIKQRPYREQTEKMSSTVAAIPEKSKKRKPGRPRKNQTANEIITKWQKTDSANTGRRRSKAGEVASPEENDGPVESKANVSSTSSSSGVSKPSPKQVRTASARSKELRSKKTGIYERANDASKGVFATETVTESDSSDDNGTHEDPHGFCHLQEHLRKIWDHENGLKNVFKRRKGLKENNESTQTLTRACRELQTKLINIAGALHLSTEMDYSDVSKSARSITKRVDELDLENEEEIRHFLLQDVYAFIIPCLLKTLREFVKFYAKIPEEPSSAQLAEIIGFTAAIINLDERAKASDYRVPTELAIVRPTRHHIIAPLRTFRGMVVQMCSHRKGQEERKKSLEVEQRRMGQANLRRQREAEEKTYRKALLDDWRGLHIARKEVEPDVRRWNHLDFAPLPSPREPEVIRDIDGNGEPFDRVVMFPHKRSPTQRYHWNDFGVEWTDSECLALMEGLATYAAMEYDNPRYMVYFKVIRKHCRPGGALRRFNVSEIVQKSLYLKVMLEDREWTRLIPTFQDI